MTSFSQHEDPTEPAPRATSDANAVGALLRYALGRDRPVDGSEYRTLVDRYRTDPGFAQTVGSFAAGLGLTPLGVTVGGLVLCADPDGPFAPSLATIGRSNGVSDRLYLGLVLVAIAAYAYPDPDMLDATATPTVEVTEVERFLTTHAAAVAGIDGGYATDVQASLAAQAWAELPERAHTPTDRLKKGCRRKYVEDMIACLVEAGLARPVPSLGRNVYQLTDAFRLGVRDIAASAAHSALAAARCAHTKAGA